MIRRDFLALAVATVSTLASANAQANSGWRRLIQDELQVLTLLASIRALGGEGGTVMDNWTAGKTTNRETLESLATLQKAIAEKQARLRALSLDRSSEPLRSGLDSVARTTSDFYSKSLSLVHQGRPDRKAVLAQWRDCLGLTRSGQRQWFDARQKFLKSLSSQLPVSSTRLLDFYEWQSKMLPLWIAQSESLMSAQELLGGLDHNASKQQAESLKVLKAVMVLNGKIQALECRSFPKCKDLASQENVGVAKVAEACFFLYEDLSSDSVSRLRRCFRVLSEASSRLENEILAATKSLR